MIPCAELGGRSRKRDGWLIGEENQQVNGERPGALRERPRFSKFLFLDGSPRAPHGAPQRPTWGDVSYPPRRSSAALPALYGNGGNGQQPRPDCPLIVALWASRTPRRAKRRLWSRCGMCHI